MQIIEAYIHQYINATLKICPDLNEDEISYLKSGLTINQLGNKHFYAHSETVQKQISFVIEGLLRMYYIDNNGDEITIRFIKENGYATDYPAFISQSKSRFNIQCLEPSVLLNLDFNYVHDGYENFNGLQKFGRLIAEAVLKGQQSRIESFQFQSAEERYLSFIEESPELFNRVSLSYLSSYLGIERQSLSRIRKKISGK